MDTETTKQLNSEISDMYERMRDPDKIEERLSKNKIKKNVERKQQRVGL